MTQPAHCHLRSQWFNMEELKSFELAIYNIIQNGASDDETQHIVAFHTSVH